MKVELETEKVHNGYVVTITFYRGKATHQAVVIGRDIDDLGQDVWKHIIEFLEKNEKNKTGK